MVRHQVSSSGAKNDSVRKLGKCGFVAKLAALLTLEGFPMQIAGPKGGRGEAEGGARTCLCTEEGA